MDKDGNVYIYKARLVVKGFKQIHGINYDETFSPVVMLKSVQILLIIAAYFDYEIWQMDVDPKHARKICKLQKSIYELK
jgi:hypothetical protein